MTYETHEVRLSDLIKQYTSSLDGGDEWNVLAIDLFTDVLVLKREVKSDMAQLKTEREVKSA